MKSPEATMGTEIPGGTSAENIEWGDTLRERSTALGSKTMEVLNTEITREHMVVAGKLAASLAVGTALASVDKFGGSGLYTGSILGMITMMMMSKEGYGEAIDSAIDTSVEALKSSRERVTRMLHAFQKKMGLKESPPEEIARGFEAFSSATTEK